MEPEPKSRNSPLSHLNNLIVDLDFTGDIRHASGIDTFDKDAWKFLCKTRQKAKKKKKKKKKKIFFI